MKFWCLGQQFLYNTNQYESPVSPTLYKLIPHLPPSKKYLIVKDPTMVPPGPRLFLLRHGGNIENGPYLLGRFAHELTRYLKASQIQQGFWRTRDTMRY